MTLTIAEVAPLAPVVEPTIVAIGALVAFIVSWGLLHAWSATLGPFLRWLGNLGVRFSVLGAHIAIQPFKFALRINTDVQKWLNQAMVASERAMVHSFKAAYNAVYQIGAAIFHLGESTYTALEHLAHAIHHTAPRVIRETVVKPITRVITKTVTTTVQRVGHLDKALERAKAELRSYTRAPSFDRGHVAARRAPRADGYQRPQPAEMVEAASNRNPRGWRPARGAKANRSGLVALPQRDENREAHMWS